MSIDRGKGGRAARVAITGAALLGGLWLWNHYQARRAERDNPPIGRFLTVDGVRLHLVDRGRGRPIVLIHGSGSLVQDFVSSVLDRLAARRRVLIFDRPGHGHSDRPRDRCWTPEAQADLIHKALLQLGVERPLIVGHSWGCLVALALGLRHPAATAGLVLLSGYLYPERRLDAVPLRLPAMPIIGPFVGNTIMPVVGRLLGPIAIHKLFAPNPVPPTFAEVPVALSLRPSQLRADAEDLSSMRPAARRLCAGYRRLAVPVTIGAGRSDRIVDIWMHAVRLARDVPWARLAVFPDTGHMVHHSRPDAVAQLIEQAQSRVDDSAMAWPADGDPSYGAAGRA